MNDISASHTRPTTRPGAFGPKIPQEFQNISKPFKSNASASQISTKSVSKPRAAFTGVTVNANGAGKYPSHDTPAQSSLSRLDPHTAVLRMRFYSTDRSLTQRSTRNRSEVPRYLCDTALRQASSHRKR